MPSARDQSAAPCRLQRARLTLRAVAVILAAAALLPRAFAQTGPLQRTPGSPVTLTLDNGDTLSGDLLASDAATITVSHPILGRLTMDRSRVLEVRSAVGASARPAVAAAPRAVAAGAHATVLPTSTRSLPASQPEPEPAPPVEVEPGLSDATESADPPPPEPARAKPTWSGRLALGFNGSDGNADRLRLRYDAGATRTFEGETLNLNLAYSIAHEGSRRSEHWLRANARNSWAYRDTPWEAFAEAETEYDEFKDYDLRVSAGGGAAFRFIDSDRTKLTTRAGVGGRREFGGTDNDITPEAIAGFEVSHQLNARHRITANATWFPSLEDLSDFRATGRAAWEILIDPELNLTLQLGAEDRYDSTPSAREHNDLDYFAQIVLKF